MANSMTAIVKSVGSRTLDKKNGAQYVLQNCLITDGPAKGMLVLATRTTLTKDKVAKEVPALGAEVTLFHSTVVSTVAGQKNQHFFEISIGGDTASNADLDTAFGL